MIDGIVNQKIAEFLATEAEKNNVPFEKVEAGMKLQEVKDDKGDLVGIKPYYFLRINNKFVRYVELSEII